MRKYTFKTADSLYCYGGELGANCDGKRTVFRVWQPMAESVSLRLYKDCVSERAVLTAAMERKARGVWEYISEDNLNGLYYTYLVNNGGAVAETIDIYAKSAGINGKRGMVIDMRTAEPRGWRRPYTRPKGGTDAVIYELHIRDFSMDNGAAFRHRGKFLAFTERDISNSFGDTAGLDYIQSLGATHIHLLPVFDFATVDEAPSKPQYNWGYDPLNYNVPEGSYSTKPTDGFARVRELRKLIMSVHERGMGVVADVVYNHTQSADSSPFGLTFPHYYYRHSKSAYSNGSGCGNELASERGMVRKYICDSLCFWAREYKLDGFRFDLMGLLDIETLNCCAEKLRKINPDILLYGEGWTGGASPLDEKLRAVKRNAAAVPRFAMFSDDFRDGVRGSVFNDADCGYINGSGAFADNAPEHSEENAPDKAECSAYGRHSAEHIKSVMLGGVYHPQVSRARGELWTDNAAQTVNYVECHDNLTLYDKLKSSMSDASEREIIAADKLAAAMVFLAQGIPFIQAGQEFLRSKNGIHDSYNSPDSVNALKWNDITRHKDLVDYYRGLIAIRKAFPMLRLTSGDDIRAAVSFTDLGGGAFAMHNGNLTVIFNPTSAPVALELGEYEVLADEERASDSPLYSGQGRAECKARAVLAVRIK